MKDPVIIIGMHRSGTSMICRMLEELGLFMGTRKDPNNEAVFFLTINEWLMNECGGAWDRPEPIDRLLKNQALRALASDYLAYYLGTRAITSYLGKGGYLADGTPLRLEKPWGWKDPRNTYTLPVWQDIFPNARIVHVMRHGIDVAQSMRVRMVREVADTMKTLEEKTRSKYRGAYYRHLAPSLWSFQVALQEPDLDRCFDLWEKYMVRARQHVAVAGERAVEIRYEDFLADPAPFLKQLAEFCGLAVTDGQIQEVAGKGNRDRAYGYRSNPELLDYEKRVISRLMPYGYSR